MRPLGQGSDDHMISEHRFTIYNEVVQFGLDSSRKTPKETIRIYSERAIHPET